MRLPIKPERPYLWKLLQIRLDSLLSNAWKYQEWSITSWPILLLWRLLNLSDTSNARNLLQECLALLHADHLLACLQELGGLASGQLHTRSFLRFVSTSIWLPNSQLRSSQSNCHPIHFYWSQHERRLVHAWNRWKIFGDWKHLWKLLEWFSNLNAKLDVPVFQLRNFNSTIALQFSLESSNQESCS